MSRRVYPPQFGILIVHKSGAVILYLQVCSVGAALLCLVPFPSSPWDTGNGEQMPGNYQHWLAPFTLPHNLSVIDLVTSIVFYILRLTMHTAPP